MPGKILLVDDEVDFTELAATLLRFHDFEVDAFNEAGHIAQLILNKKYDMIVTDLMMPDLNGFKLIQAIRALPDYVQTPIIVLSAKILTDEERKFLMQHKIHFVMKPFEPQDLVEKIGTLIAK
ncbi:MAG: DNA-binding response regulator [uncultured bacterium]|nr:MAG: DNA-binding response regulator [uncultured bacterium]